MTAPENEKSRYPEAIAALKRGQAAEALTILENLESQGRNAPEYWRLRGVCTHKAGDPDAAEGHLRHAVELDRSYVASWTTLAKHYEERKREKDALATYRDALAENPESAELNTERGGFYQFQAAGVSASRAGIDPRVLLVRGTEEDHHRTAVEFFEKAYSNKAQLSTPKQSRLLGALCHNYWFLGDKRKAGKFLEEARRVDPNSHMISALELIRNHAMTRPVRIRAVAPQEGFKVHLEFTDNTSKEIDLESYLHGPIFEPIRRDPRMFRSVKVDPQMGTVVWENGADIDPDVLYQGLTPAWMEDQSAHELTTHLSGRPTSQAFFCVC